MKWAEVYRVLDRRVSGQDLDTEVLPNVLDPTALADGPQPESDRFVRAFCRHSCLDADNE